MKNELIDNLESLNNLFTKIGENFWNNKIEIELDHLKKGNYSINEICKNILSWYGGMGSFNDLYICKENGYDIEESDEIELNNEIQILSEQLYNICSGD